MIKDSESNDAQPSKISFEDSFKPDFTLSNDPIELIKSHSNEDRKDNNSKNIEKDSNDVNEDIKVPKKIMKEENNIVEEDKVQNEINKNRVELEKEEGREIEDANYDKIVQEFNENVKKSNSWKKNKFLMIFLKYVFLIIIISLFIILLIIYISK